MHMRHTHDGGTACVAGRPSALTYCNGFQRPARRGSLWVMENVCTAAVITWPPQAAHTRHTPRTRHAHATRRTPEPHGGHAHLLFALPASWAACGRGMSGLQLRRRAWSGAAGCRIRPRDDSRAVTACCGTSLHPDTAEMNSSSYIGQWGAAGAKGPPTDEITACRGRFGFRNNAVHDQMASYQISNYITAGGTA